MRIAEIHLYQHDLPVHNGPYTMANAEVWETCPLGATYAEAYAAGARAAIMEISQGLIGTEVLPLTLHRRMDALLNGHHYAKAALDIALFDLLGKHLNLSVSALLGGAATDKVPSYFATGVGQPDDIARLAKEKREEGYPRIQVKVGGRPVEIDIETIHKVWETIKDSGMRMAVDANRGWSVRDAVHASRACADIPMIVEQPCSSIEELKAFREQSLHPLYMDESCVDLNTAISAAGERLVDGFGMKLTRLGGLHKMMAFRDMCEARSLPHTCDDSWGGDIIAAACTHIGATVAPNLSEGVWIAAPYIEGHYDKDNGIKLEGGHICCPQGPGLGIRPDESLFGEPVFSA